MVKEFFQEHKTEFSEVDVAADPQARDELIKLSGQLAVPVVIADDDMIIGFDQARLEALVRGGSAGA